MENNNSNSQTEVWNLIYSFLEMDYPLSAAVHVKTFSTENAAYDALKKDYDETVKEIEGGATILDCVGKEYSGNNACIKLGHETDGGMDDGSSEVEVVHKWRVSKTTVDLHA